MPVCNLLIYLYFGFNVICYSGIIDDAPLRFRGEVYHGYHFNCTSCNVELDSTAREVKSRPGYAANDMVITNRIQFPKHIEIINWNFRMSCIAFDAMTRWEFQYVVLAVDQLRNVWLQLLVNTGMLR